MARATVQYSFEWTLFGWAGQLSHTLTGENRGFVMVFAPDGAVREVHFGHQENKSPSNNETLTNNNPSYFFYDPFDSPEYTYIQRQNVEQGTLERLVGKPFAANDLALYLSQSAGSSEAPAAYPTSWSVMF